MKDNWYLELKHKIVLLDKQYIYLESLLANLVKNNPWILADINACESYYKLLEIDSANEKDLISIIDYVNHLEEKCICFSRDELLSEYQIIEENYYLEFTFLLNILRYVVANTNFYNGTSNNDLINEYYNYDDFCFNQIKLNETMIKELKKERRD